MHKQAQATLHSGLDLRAAVRLPRGENYDDWLAVHSQFSTFLEMVSLIFSVDQLVVCVGCAVCILVLIHFCFLLIIQFLER